MKYVESFIAVGHTPLFPQLKHGANGFARFGGEVFQPLGHEGRALRPRAGPSQFVARWHYEAGLGGRMARALSQLYEAHEALVDVQLEVDRARSRRTAQQTRRARYHRFEPSPDSKTREPSPDSLTR
jgi:hypothetical protein